VPNYSIAFRDERGSSSRQRKHDYQRLNSFLATGNTDASGSDCRKVFFSGFTVALLNDMKNDISELSGAELATELAIMRTALALDRTLLAWVRTSLGFIGFGFTLAKFVSHLTRTGQLSGLPITGPESPTCLGLMMMTLGLLGLIGAGVDHWRAEKKLMSKSVSVSPWSFSFILAIMLAAVTVLLTGILALEAGHKGAAPVEQEQTQSGGL
jgi:putative membrane protein